jgi:hypothetical protein
MVGRLSDQELKTSEIARGLNVLLS